MTSPATRIEATLGDLRAAGVGPVTAWVFWLGVKARGPKFKGDPEYVPARSDVA